MSPDDRVLRVLVTSPVADLYGSSLSMLETLDRIAPEHVHVAWAVPAAGALTGELTVRGVPFTVVPELRLARARDSVWAQATKLARAVPIGSLRLARIAKANSIDVIHSNSSAVLAGAYGSRLARLPHVWHARELIPRSGPFAPLLRREMPARAEALICVSSAVAEQFADPHGKVQVLHDGLDWTRLRRVPRSEARAALGIPDDAIAVGSCGYLNPRKGMDLLLEGYARARGAAQGPTRLIFAGAPFPGNEDFADGLRRRSRELDIAAEVIMPGYVEQISLLLSALDVFALTTREPEGLGRAVLEAMALELPVVATGRGGMLDIVEDGRTGMLVDPPTDEAIGAALGRLFADTALRHRLGAAGREEVRSRFQVEHTAERLLGTYRRLAP